MHWPAWWKISLPAIFCTILWGSAYPCIKKGYIAFGIADGTFWDRLVFAGIRFTLAGILTLAMHGIRNRRCYIRPALPFYKYFGLGLVFTTAQYVCFYVGLANSMGARSAVLNAASSFFTVLVAALWIPDERLTARKIIGCLLGFCGILVMNLGGSLGGRFTLNGDFMVLLSTLAFGIGSVWSKQLARREHPILLSGFQLTLGGLVLLLLGCFGGGRLYALNRTGVFLMVYMVLLSCGAFSVWTWLLHKYSAGAVSVYFFLVPVFGVLFSALFLRERIAGFSAGAALALVCSGIIIVNRPSKAGGRTLRT